MSDVAIYEFYNSIIKFCNTIGHYVANKALLENIKSGYPSPDALRVMVNSHGGDVVKLEKKVSDNRTERRNAWETTMNYSIALDNYERLEAICFVTKLEQTEDVDAFRKTVHHWCKKELEIFDRDGCWTTEDGPLSFGKFIRLYEKSELNHTQWGRQRRKILASKKDRNPVD